MKNERFILTPGEKQRKLSALLRSRTNDSLTGKQLRHIIHGVASGLQYNIDVFTEPSGFCDALILENSEEICDRGEIVFGQALFGKSNETGNSPGQLCQDQDPAAAIITRSVGIPPETTARTILIYVPTDLYLKGAGTYERQRIQKEHCV